jgi:hypothetical protein
MPKEIEDRLRKQAAKQGLKGERKDAYVYGTLNKIEKAHDAKHTTHKPPAKRGKK